MLSILFDFLSDPFIKYFIQTNELFCIHNHKKNDSQKDCHEPGYRLYSLG